MPAAEAPEPEADGWVVVIDWCPVPDAKQPFKTWVAARSASDEELEEKVRVEVIAGETGEMMRMLAEPAWLGDGRDDYE